MKRRRAEKPFSFLFKKRVFLKVWMISINEQQNKPKRMDAKMWIETKNKSFKIFQVLNEKTREYGFMGYDMMERLNVKVRLENYGLVYVGAYVESNDDNEILNKLFHDFNTNHPRYYNGRSMSVSDIVQIENKYYFCDSFGWQEIEL
jgi:hypothetical protein